MFLRSQIAKLLLVKKKMRGALDVRHGWWKLLMGMAA